MDTSKHIKHIREAKRSHISWVSHAYALKIGMPLKKEQVPMHATDCQFGHWYYGEGQSLIAIKAFKDVELPHINLHTTYMEMFNLLFKNEPEVKPGFWVKLFGQKSNTEEKNPMEKEQIEQFYLILKKHSEAVINALNELEEVMQLQEKAQQNQQSQDFLAKLKVVN